MIDYRELESVFSRLGLSRRPVAVTYRDHEPIGVRRFEGTTPSGCTFWRLAAEGGAFYTVPADHYNCPVGSYTHAVDLPASRQSELLQVLDIMTGLGYLRMEEVPGIARLEKPSAAVVYSPLGETPFDPDVVLFVGEPGKLMLLQEAAIRAGSPVQMSLGRPTCMALPAAMKQGVVASSGCIGNRVYAGIGDRDDYLVIAGKELPTIAAEITVIALANEKLREYHENRLGSLLEVRN